MSAYQSLHDAFQKIHYFEHCLTILHWDQDVMMPEGGADERGRAIGELEALVHQHMCAPEMAEWLTTVSRQEGLTEEQLANVREMRRQWQNSNLLPEALVREQAIAHSRCQSAWSQLRGQNDWRTFCDSFTPVVRLAQEQARIRQAALKTATPYEALLSLYSCGDSVALMGDTFSLLKAQLPDMIKTVSERQRRETRPVLTGNYSVARQEQLSRYVTALLGFDFSRGRLDVSAHPFSTGNIGDQRITTRYQTDDFIGALYGTVHETGHARYEAGLPTQWRGQPVGLARNMSIHESQSLFFEKHIGTTLAFCERVATQANTLFATALTGAQLKQAVCWVEPGLIRVDADELSYPLHIILRYDIESALINGDMTVADIPDAWHEKMQHYLGLGTENNYQDGCMQDVHWPSGAFGYFPSYTLGAVNAAQLRVAMESAVGDINGVIAEGDLSPIMQWLQENIWQWGSLLESQELMRNATGKPTDGQSLLDHFRRQYAL